LWTTRLLARHARKRGPAAGHQCLANLVQGTVCKILGREEIKPHKVKRIRELRAQGMGMVAIARKLRCGTGTV
jgi:DNA invertase Pin-like site-specific DNA recombinase